MTVGDMLKVMFDFDDNRYFIKEKLLPWQVKNLQYTSSGYGRKIPSPWMILDGRRWKRVYVCIYSNSGICYFIRNKKEIYLRS